MGFQAAGEVVYLLGVAPTPGADQSTRDLVLREPQDERIDGLRGEPGELAGSEYLRQLHGLVAGSVRIDLALEARVQRVLVEAAKQGILRSAHDCSHGGLAVALAEACLANGIGFGSEGLRLRGRRDAALFGETPSRVVVSVREDEVVALEELLGRNETPFMLLGRTGGDRVRLAGIIDAALSDLEEAYEGGLEAALRE
jgi:phosphoribosylformylglycinamidine synthase